MLPNTAEHQTGRGRQGVLCRAKANPHVVQGYMVPPKRLESLRYHVKSTLFRSSGRHSAPTTMYIGRPTLVVPGSWGPRKLPQESVGLLWLSGFKSDLSGNPPRNPRSQALCG